jgi:hypothetical protein
MQASMLVHLVHHHEVALHVPLVDLVKEGLQYGLNRFVRLGLDIGDQLVVALPFIFIKHLLDIFQSQKGVIKAENVSTIVQVKRHAKNLHVSETSTKSVPSKCSVLLLTCL